MPPAPASGGCFVEPSGFFDCGLPVAAAVAVAADEVDSVESLTVVDDDDDFTTCTAWVGQTVR